MRIGDAAAAWGCELVLKVKEPMPSEFGYLQDDQVLFTYLHLAANPGVADALRRAGTTAVAYETVEDAAGRLPLLAPISEIAGRLSVQAGARHLERPQAARGAAGRRGRRRAGLGGGHRGRHRGHERRHRRRAREVEAPGGPHRHGHVVERGEEADADHHDDRPVER